MIEHIDVLDHGYVKLVETWGSDERIIEAARMSTNKGFQGWEDKCKTCGTTKEQAGSGGIQFACAHVWQGDERLLRYLYKNKHSTPFEMAGLIIEVQAPIFVMREWMRHRTQSFSEMSARYTPLPDLNYIPSVERLMMSDGTNKQAQGMGDISKDTAEDFVDGLKDTYESLQGMYSEALAEGVPKELARLVLPVGRYSRMRASANLRNWLGFLTLRMADNAQWEIVQYANAVGRFVEQAFPRTYELFLEESAK